MNTVTLLLHPATGENAQLQYVCLTLEFFLPSEVRCSTELDTWVSKKVFTFCFLKDAKISVKSQKLEGTTVLVLLSDQNNEYSRAQGCRK